MFAKIAGLFMLGSHPTNNSSRPLKNVFEAADARQKQAKKRSLCMINEHFESVFNTAAATQIVFQRPVKPMYFWNFNSYVGCADCKEAHQTHHLSPSIS